MITRGAVVGSLRELDTDKSWRDEAGAVTWPWPKLERDDYLEPGRPYRLDLSLAPRQWGVKPGHRLRLEITTQTPADLCPATTLPASNDADPCRLTGPQQKTVPGGVYTLLYGEQAPSVLNLPQLPYKAFPEVRAGLLTAPWSEGNRRVEAAVPDAKRFPIALDWGN